MGLVVATGCPAEGGEDAGDSDAMTTMPGATDTGTEEESTAAASMDSTGGGNTDLSHAADIQPIWDAHCVTACHEPEGEWGFLLDMSGDAYDNIVEVMAPQLASMDHISPGSTMDSYIWHKINNTQATVGGSGLPMPKEPIEGEPTMLTADEKATIEAWILAGAPE